MNVYMVVQWEYQGYEVKGVYLNREHAEIHMRNVDRCEVIEFAVLESAPLVPDGMQAYQVSYNSRFDVFNAFLTDDFDKVGQSRINTRNDDGVRFVYFDTVLFASDKVDAENVARERRDFMIEALGSMDKYVHDFGCEIAPV